jgi:hypothetical protein
VRDLAQQWTAGQGNAYDKALAIENQLRQYPQSYNIPIVPPGRDAVDLFLFDTKQGYSDYQASAMVVLLRAAGVPARLATGFAVDEYDLNLHKYIVREKSAESWPEVFFPTYGWVEFSPFGGAPLVSRPAIAGGDPGTGPDVQQDPIIKGGGPNLFGGEFIGDVPLFPGEETPGAFHYHHPFNWLPVYAGLTALALLLIGAGVLRFAWELPLRGLDYPSRTWEKTLRLSRWLRIGPSADQTPREFAASLAARTKLTDEPRAVADSYLRNRYGRAEANTTDQRALDRAWSRLRNRLLKRLLRLK